ncbi:hypothetical protein LTS18_009708 [Coniosporium uncinatum]|uniref:Uncharacterized protein n=1 Tax=Coniosporium uncinatum TaxID=93489 RepID=A0ACC3DC90_9PEZI|nr:hypothetical protein LTS18_009708 [Coniosporium uncinatum]
MKHGDDKMIKHVKNFDYVRTVLYTSGLLILLMGLNWGGSVWPWASAHVIATIVVGFLALVAFVLYESFTNLKEPLVPMHLFQNRAWNAATIVSGLGASIYYAFALVWPQMVIVLYSDASSPMYGPWLSSLVGLFIILGEIVGGFSAQSIGKLRYQCIATLALGGIFFACVATCTPDTKVRAAVFVSLGVFSVGWVESIAITMVTLTAKDQQELGSASGVAGSIRFLNSSIAASVYSVILSNRLAQTIATEVPPALINAGLPAFSVESFITGLSIGPTALKAVQGITPNILAIGTRAYQDANSSAYRTVFLSTIAFTGVAIIASLFLPDVDHLLTGKVATTLHEGKDEKKIVGT